jgi:hypothetical protein
MEQGQNGFEITGHKRFITALISQPPNNMRSILATPRTLAHPEQVSTPRPSCKCRIRAMQFNWQAKERGYVEEQQAGREGEK